MDRRIDAHVARTQLGQIMDLAVKNNERFIVDRRGEPSVVIMSVQDFIRTVAPPPDWLTKAWAGAKRRGLDALTPENIDAEIAAHRSEKAAASREAGNLHFCNDFCEEGQRHNISSNVRPRAVSCS